MADYKGTIVWVDDEEAILRIVQRHFSRMPEYKIITYQYPRKAVEEMKQHNPLLVVSDYIMPEMNGVQVLEYVREHLSEAKRIMCSATPPEGLDGLIHGLIIKPLVLQEAIDSLKIKGII